MWDWVRGGAIAAAALAVGVAAGFLVWGRKSVEHAFERRYPDGGRVRVARVIDGDTVVLDDGVHVRYRGCDTPETMHFVRDPEPFADEAAGRNRELVEGAWVTLHLPPPGKRALDEHGRLLAELRVGAGGGRAGRPVGDILVREGLAKARTFDIEDAARSRLAEAEKEAKSAGRGVWGEAPAGSERAAPGAPGGFLLASRSGKYVHRAGCEYAKRISPGNLFRYATVEAASAEGKGRCPTCFAAKGAGPVTKKAAAKTPGVAAKATGPFVASRSGKYVHRPDCEYAQRISPRNLVKYAAIDEGLKTGKQKCPTCLAPEQIAPAAKTPGVAAKATGPFVASRSGKYVHRPDCAYAKRISPEGLLGFDTLKNATADGGKLCPTCFGLVRAGKPAGSGAGGPFVASKSGKYVHRADCVYAKSISPKNLVKYAVIEKGVKEGKELCPTCFAPKPAAPAAKKTAAKGPAPVAPSNVRPGPPFTASRKGKYIHQPGCVYGDRIAKENLLKFDSLEAALETGKQKCPTCFAPKKAPVAAKAPAAAKTAAEEAAGMFDDHIDVSLFADGRIMVEERQYSLESLGQLLARRAKLAEKDDNKLPKLSVRIRGSRDIGYARVQEVMKLCMREYVSNLSFGDLGDEPPTGSPPADAAPAKR